MKSFNAPPPPCEPVGESVSGSITRANARDACDAHLPHKPSGSHAGRFVVMLLALVPLLFAMGCPEWDNPAGGEYVQADPYPLVQLVPLENEDQPETTVQDQQNTPPKWWKKYKWNHFAAAPGDGASSARCQSHYNAESWNSIAENTTWHFHTEQQAVLVRYVWMWDKEEGTSPPKIKYDVEGNIAGTVLASGEVEVTPSWCNPDRGRTEVKGGAHGAASTHASGGGPSTVVYADAWDVGGIVGWNGDGSVTGKYIKSPPMTTAQLLGGSTSATSFAQSKVWTHQLTDRISVSGVGSTHFAYVQTDLVCDQHIKVEIMACDWSNSEAKAKALLITNANGNTTISKPTF